MCGFKNGIVITDVAAGGKTESTDQLRGQIGKDITEHIFGHHHTVIHGVLNQPHGLGVDVGFPKLNAGIVFGHFTGGTNHQAAGFAQHIGLIHHGHAFITVRPGIFKGLGNDVAALLTAHDARGDSQVFQAIGFKFFHFRMVFGQNVVYFLRYGMKLDPAIHAFGVFTEDHQVDTLLKVQRIAGIGLAGAQVGVQVKMLT